MSRSYPDEATFAGEELHLLRNLSDSLADLWYECKELHDQSNKVQNWDYERKLVALGDAIVSLTDQIEDIDNAVVSSYERKLYNDLYPKTQD